VGNSHAQVAALCVLATAAACHRDPIGDAWTTADWTEAGVPDPGHEWTSDELDLAVKAIEKAIGVDRHRRPAFHGSRGGAVFARVVSEPVLDPKADPRARFSSIELGLEAHHAFSNLYPIAALEPASRESIETLGVMFDDYARLEPAIDPFLATFGSDDASLDARRKSVLKVQVGLGLMLHHAFLVANDRRISVVDRVALLGYVGHAIPAAFPHLTPDVQDKLRSDAAVLVHATTGDLHDAAAAVLRLVPP
jgi:hypothetical protein